MHDYYFSCPKKERKFEPERMQLNET